MKTRHAEKTVYLDAPSCWASGLINNDWSGISDEEHAQAEKWLEFNGLPPPVSCDDAGFMANHDARMFADAADCQRYAFLVDV